MTIKSFEEYQVEIRQLFEAKDAYNAGIAEAKAFYENEKEAKEVIKRINPEAKKPSTQEIKVLNEAISNSSGEIGSSVPKQKKKRK